MKSRQCEFTWTDCHPFGETDYRCREHTYRNSRLCQKHLGERKRERESILAYASMRRNRERTEALGDWLDLHLQDLIQVGKDSINLVKAGTTIFCCSPIVPETSIAIIKSAFCALSLAP